MPKIPIYNAGDLGLRANDAGLDQWQSAGRRIGASGDEILSAERASGKMVGDVISEAGGVAVDFIDHEQISHGAAQLAAIENSLNQEWDAKLSNSNPNDPSVADHFREKSLEPALESFRESFTTRKGQEWAEAHVARVREHYWRKTTADQSNMARVAATTNVHTLANSYSSAAAADPASIDHILGQVDEGMAGIIDSSPNLSPEQRAHVKGEVTFKVKEKVVQSAINSAMLRNPDVALKMAGDARYSPYLDGADVNRAYKDAKQAEKADALAAKQIREQQIKENTEQNAIKILADIHGDNPTVTAKDILALPDEAMTYERRKDLVNVIEKRSGDVGQAKQNAVQMIMDVHAGKITNEDQIYKAYGEGKLDYERFQQVQREFKEAKSPAGENLSTVRGGFMRQYGAIVNPYDPDAKLHHPDGYEREYQLYRYAVQREDELRAAGTDPHALYDPRSPEFLGNTIYAKPEASSTLLARGARDAQRGGGKMGPFQGGPPAPVSKTINGKTYWQYGGKWHDAPEAQ